MNKQEKNKAKLLSFLESIETTNELTDLLNTTREYTLDRLKKEVDRIEAEQTEIKNKIEKLNNN